MLQTLVTQSVYLTCWILLKKAALASFLIYASLVYGGRVPRDYRQDIALVSTPDQGSFAGICIDNRVDGVSVISVQQFKLSC